MPAQSVGLTFDPDREHRDSYDRERCPHYNVASVHPLLLKLRRAYPIRRVWQRYCAPQCAAQQTVRERAAPRRGVWCVMAAYSVVFMGSGRVLHSLMRSIGNATNPTPTKNIQNHHPRNDKNAIKNTGNVTSIFQMY